MRISYWSSDVCSSDLVSVSKKLVDMWKSEGTAYAAEVNDGRYLESDGKSGPPSWANDEQMQRDFATGVQILSGPDGLSPEALNAMFSLEQPLDKPIANAGAFERKGEHGRPSERERVVQTGLHTVVAV